MIRTQKLAKINRLVCEYFQQNLEKNKRAKAYVNGRIPEKLQKEFRLGYAPQRGFVEFLNTHNVSEPDAVDLGLVTLDLDDNAIPIFTNRIVFPISHAGRVVGFAGRVIQGGTPKYLNTKASPLYDKKKLLYGLWKSRRSIHKLNCAYIVEGYIDVISLCSEGVNNSVALCGTAMTIYQARLLKRYTDRVRLVLDSDKAGNIAADRAKKILKKAGIYGGKITLPKGTDPDEFIKANGKRAFKKLKIGE